MAWSALPKVVKTASGFKPVIEPRITVSFKNKSLVLNSMAADLIGNPDYVVLMVDEGKRLIGIRAAWPDDDRSYLRKSSKITKTQGSRVVTIGSALKALGIKNAHDLPTMTGMPVTKDGILTIKVPTVGFRTLRNQRAA